MSILVCGSLAYDTLLTFEDRFDQHILADQLHKISTTFRVPTMRREFGGCAGNIAYNLALLGERPLVMATVGEDFDPYREHLARLGVADRHIRTVPGQYTAQCFIISDSGGNQLMAFHPGAMEHATDNHLSEVESPVELAIVAPSGYLGCLQHCRELAEAGIPLVFDPGQELPLFSRTELRALVEMASYVTLNDYEAELMRERAGLTLDDMRRQVRALIITRGAQGAEIHVDDTLLHIPAVPLDGPALDPSGCGDAFRAGLLYGIRHGLDWHLTGRLANLLGAIKVVSRGAQNHVFDWAQLKERYQAAYNEAWPD
ncbi:carbohydrate kinase family protein [Pseudogulbenkiania ferrooxidans]|uniref:PfkB domain protein n=1 Tax=Pseudogulbenkiania ferrooxidans 2002 TaxID=279714 RepID=B9Z604_9NEIS|nr:carbohydrate kinase family protein [Pseudogulbenkiania ferrooxidans]EEG08001.1 PfkB domain protein [Pseudogulbenkiania ferrooxidans 2002]